MKFILIVPRNLMSTYSSIVEKTYISCLHFIKCGPQATFLEIVSITIIFLNFVNEEMS